MGAGAPNTSTALAQPCSAEVLFTVNASTSFGQNIYIAGNVTKLGGRLDDPSAIILPLSAANYTWQRPEWYVDIWLKAGQTVQYQYVLQNGSDWVFEKRAADAKRLVHVGKCGSSRVVEVSDAAVFT